MIKIPGQSRQHSTPNNSDLFGTINYTKNINLDEEGYVKLSSRTISILSERDDGDVGLPVAFGRSGSIDGTLTFYVQTADKAFTTDITETAITNTQDASSPQYTIDSHGRWFHNLWVTTEDNDFFVGSGGSYTDKGNLTTLKSHPVEVFKNRNSICFGDGNTVVQYTESGGTFTASTTLTLPAGFEVIKLAYSNNKMGVLTILDPDTNSGTNEQALFFLWDGATTSAEQGLPIGSDKGVDIVSYKGSFAVLTRTGQLLFYTGGGFTPLANFPFYFKNLDWGTSYGKDSFGDILQVEGDLIYIHFNGGFTSSGNRYERHSQESPAGIWCYDPKIGLYHRYSPSVSQASMLTVTSGNINTTTNVLTKSAGTIPPTGSPVKYLSSKTIGQNIGGLATPTVYYIIKSSATEFKLATSKVNADAGSAVDITSTGAANNYFMALEELDYGQLHENRAGAVDFVGGKKQQFDHLIVGADLTDYDSSTGATSDTVCVTCPGFENRGYFVTVKMPSEGVTDKGQKVVVKYRPLRSGDAVYVKVKDRTLSGLPVSTHQGRSSSTNLCTWLAADTFSTTADLSDALTAYTAGHQLECEVIAGAGSGVLAKVSTVTYDAGTYSVALAEDVVGAATSRYCDVIIDNWKELGSITSSDTEGYKQFAVETSKPWVKFKVELRGVETTVEEVQFINSVHKPSA